mgnify:CR=1 FL=1
MTKAGDSILRGLDEAIDYAKGDRNGFIAHVPDDIDVRQVRASTKLSQAKFAATYGFTLDSIRNWEQHRRHPDTATRAYLMVIEHDPDSVLKALTEQSKKKAPATA